MAIFSTVTITELRIASRNPQGSEVDVLRLATAVHQYIIIDGCVFDKKAEEWVNTYFDTLKKVLNAFGNQSSERVKKAFTLMQGAFTEHEQRIVRRPRQKSPEQVALAA